MAGTLTFNVGETRRLIEHTRGCKEHAPSYVDLFNKAYHKGGKIKKREDGWPDQDNLDTSLIPTGLWLVKDQGVYLMSNGTPGLSKSEGGDSQVVVYARECNPGSVAFDDWYDLAQRIMGGDDCVITLPVEMFEGACKGKANEDAFRLKVTARDIRVLDGGK